MWSEYVIMSLEDIIPVPIGFFQRRLDAETALRKYVESGVIIEEEDGKRKVVA